MHYSDPNFWKKIKAEFSRAGRGVIEKALLLYYALQGPDTPTWAKSLIIGSLAYFIFPFDAIFDAIPGVGYSDDLGVLAAALAAVIHSIDEETKLKAKQKLLQWFPEQSSIK